MKGLLSLHSSDALLLESLKELFLSVPGERGMMAERTDEIRSSTHPDAILRLEGYSAVESEKGIRDAHRIVQSPEGIHKDIKTGTFHPLTYGVREAAPYKEYLLSREHHSWRG